MMMKSVFWWRKPEYPEETTDLRQVIDECHVLKVLVKLKSAELTLCSLERIGLRPGVSPEAQVSGFVLQVSPPYFKCDPCGGDPIVAGADPVGVGWGARGHVPP